MPVEFLIDGVCVGAATMATMLDGPFGSALFLIRTLRERGVAIPPGIWVSAGAITGVHEIVAGQRADALFDGRFAVACTVTPLSEIKKRAGYMEQAIEAGAGGAPVPQAGRYR